MTILQKIFRTKKYSNKFNKIDVLCIVSGLFVFATVALWTITKSSIWFDEAFGAYLIRFNFWDIARYTAADVHPPLYYWLLKLWSMLFGNSELALRSMSVLFGAIAIVFGYLLIHRLFGKKAARVSLLFMALSPMLVRYGQEMRMYTLVTAIALAATYVLTYAVTTKKRLPWVIYGILVSLGMWTHYFSAIVWLAHWIWQADNVRRVAKKGKFIKTFFSKEWVFAHIVAVGLFLPWLPFFLFQLFVVQAFGFWIGPITPDTLVNFSTNVFYYQGSNTVVGWLAFVFLVVVIFLGILSYKSYKALNEVDCQSYRLIIAIAFVPILLLLILSLPPLRSSFIDRYLITSIVGIALFIGVTLTLGSKKIKLKHQIIFGTVMTVMMVIGIGNVWHFGNFNNNSHASNNTRQIIEAAVEKSSDGQPIIAATPWLFYEAVFYSTNNHPVYYIDPVKYQFGSLAMLKDNDQFKIKDINEFTKSHPIFWYVGYSTEGKLDAPYANWQSIQQVKVNDSFSNKPAYKAVQYSVSN